MVRKVFAFAQHYVFIYKMVAFVGVVTRRCTKHYKQYNLNYDGHTLINETGRKYIFVKEKQLTYFQFIYD